MVEKANVNVRLLEEESGSGTQDGEIDVTVSFQNGQASSNTATISVRSQVGDFSAEKQTDSLGSADFGPLPIETYTVTVSSSGYQTEEITVQAEDFGGADVTRNF